MTNEQPCYQAFLLRVWQSESEGNLAWRASLENVHTSERRGFASLEMLCAFLKELAGGEIQIHQPPSKVK